MNLIAAMQTELSRCKRLLYRWVLPLNAVVFGAAVVTCFSLPERLSGLMALGVLVIQVITFVLRELASECQARGEEVRRMAMLQAGLGLQPSSVGIARLRETIGELKHEEPAFLQPYYESSEPEGPRRLLGITSECAFFTAGNARRMWKVVGALAVGGLLVTVVAFTAAVFVAPATVALTAAKLVVASMAFWSTGDFAAMALSFKGLREKADAVLSGCEQSLTSAQSTEALERSALILFSEYNCAMAKAPPIAGWIYERYRDLMNEAWRERHRPSIVAG